MQLRQLQTMVEVSAEKNTTLIFPIPIELFEHSRPTGAANQAGARSASAPKTAPQAAKAPPSMASLIDAAAKSQPASPAKQESADAGSTITVSEPEKNKQKA